MSQTLTIALGLMGTYVGYKWLQKMQASTQQQGAPDEGVRSEPRDCGELRYDRRTGKYHPPGQSPSK